MTVLLLILASCGRPPSNNTPIVTSIGGRVLDADTSQPVNGANLRSEPATSTPTTRNDGAYVLDKNVKPDTSYRIFAAATGYETNSVTLTPSEGENTVADIVLSKAGAHLKLSTTSVQVSAGASQGQFLIDNDGVKSQSLTFTATPAQEWMTTGPSQGSVTSTAQAVKVTVDRAKLPAGTDVVTGVVDVATNGGSGQVQVSVSR